MGKEWNQKRWYGHEGLGCHMPFWSNGMLSYSVSIPWDLFLNGLCQLQEKLEESMEICAKSVKSMGLDYFICILYVKSIELYNWRSLWLWTSIRKGAFQQHGDRLKERLLEKIKKIEMGIQKKMWKYTEMSGNAWKCPIAVDAFDHHWVWRSGRCCSCSCRSKILPLIFWSHRPIRSGFDGFASLITQNARLNPITKF